MRRRGFTATEVIVAVAVLALAVLPVFWTTTQGQKQVRLTEYHVIAQARVKRLLEAYATYGLEGLRDSTGGADGPLPAPFDLGSVDSSFELPEEYRRKMENFDESCDLETVTDDLALIRCRVTWTIGKQNREYRLSRMVGAETLAVPPDPPLNQR